MLGVVIGYDTLPVLWEVGLQDNKAAHAWNGVQKAYG